MKLYIIPIIILLLTTPILAQYNGYSLQELKSEYNQNLDKIPGIVKAVIGDERINLYITEKQSIIGALTENAKIITIQEGKIDNPTLNIYITEKTIRRLQNQEITFQQAIDAEEIRLESQRIRTSIKLWLADKIATIISWF